MEPVLQLEEIRAGYRDREVLAGISLSVQRGELCAILGPNGAGKSTLVRACLGMMPLRGGTLRLDGKPLSDWPPEQLARFAAWVPQNTESIGGFTGLELVLMGRAPYLGRWGLPSRADVTRAEAALEELGILPLAHRPVDRLSGGERRLLFFARALVQEPRLLFLDEPTAFLDLHHQVQSLECLRRRVQGGMAVVAILHDVNLAAAFADRVLLLRDGAVLAAGITRQVLRAETLQQLYQVSIAEAAVGGQSLFAPRRAE
ncbi:MAG: ABC transporter ATP-binding protein [Myxococcota bacterium]|nr:ABC transporter ATP-binding protein [Myxococcota bacterium]